MLVGHSLSAFAATFEFLADAVVGGDRPTSAGSAYPRPVPAPWHPPHRTGPTPRLQPTTPSADAIALPASLAISSIAAAHAPRRPDKAPLPVPWPPASCPWYTLSVTSDLSHSRLPETHGTPKSVRPKSAKLALLFCESYVGLHHALGHIHRHHLRSSEFLLRMSIETQPVHL